MAFLFKNLPVKYQNLTTAHVMSLTTNVCQWKDGWTEVFGISPHQYWSQ